jgi:hypothetical protein
MYSILQLKKNHYGTSGTWMMGPTLWCVCTGKSQLTLVNVPVQTRRNNKAIPLLFCRGYKPFRPIIVSIKGTRKCKHSILRKGNQCKFIFHWLMETAMKGYVKNGLFNQPGSPLVIFFFFCLAILPPLRCCVFELFIYFFNNRYYAI